MRKSLISLAAASLVVTSSIADVDTIPNIATDGTGQFLIAPAFFATADYETDLKLVNTDTDSLFLYRVTVRDYVSSEEVDFPICLTPGDVWSAKISNQDGRVFLSSTDESNILPALKVGSSQKLDLSKANPAAVGNYAAGYVEFYPIVEVDTSDNGLSQGTSMGDAQADDPRRVTAIDKKYCSALYSYVSSQNNGTLVQTDVPGEINNELLPADASTYGPLAGHLLRVVNDDAVSGTVKLINSNTAITAAMTIPMLALEDVVDSGHGWSDKIIPSGSIVSQSASTAPANYLQGSGAVDVDGLLQTAEVTVPFSNSGKQHMQLLTFWADGWIRKATAIVDGTPKSVVTGYQTRNYVVDIRDEEENTIPGPSPEGLSVVKELGIISIDADIFAKIEGVTIPAKGWINITGFRNSSSNQASTAGNAGKDIYVRTLTNPSVISTMLTAEMVGDRWTTNWVYNTKFSTNDNIHNARLGGQSDAPYASYKDGTNKLAGDHFER